MAYKTHFRSQRFVQALQEFQQSRHLSLVELAEAVGVPYFTLIKWMRGSFRPSVVSIRKVSDKLQWDAAVFELPDGLFCKLFEEKFLTLESVAERFSDFTKAWSGNALLLVPVAGAIGYAQLCAAGLNCTMKVENFDVTYHFHDPVLACHTLFLRGTLSNGQMWVSLISTRHSLQVRHVDWTLLSRESFRHCVKELKEFVNHGQK